MDDKLQRRGPDPSALSNLSLTPFEETVAHQLHLTRVNSKSEPDELFDAEFMRVFAKEPPEALQWVFEEWRRTSPYMPAISEIADLLHAWHREKFFAIQEAREKRERQELEQARKEGKLVGWPEAVKECAEASNVPVKVLAEQVAKRMRSNRPSATELKDRREMLRQQAQKLSAK